MNQSKALAILQATLWLCISGFLYEAIVDVPNLLGPSGVDAQAVWARYHHTADPGWFFAGPMLASLVSMTWLRLRCPEVLNCWTAAIYQMLALQLGTGVAVLFINPTLYFGGPLNDPSQLPMLALGWAILNLARLAAAVALLRTFGAKLQIT